MTNQVPPFAGRDLLADDPALAEGLARWGGDGAVAGLEPLARLAGSEPAQEHGRLADTHRPVLRTFDSRGHRVDEVEFHPSWHWLLGQAVGAGLTAGPWTAPPASGAHVRRAAGFVVWSRVEAGHGCPVSMTYAAGGRPCAITRSSATAGSRRSRAATTSPASGPSRARPVRSPAWG